ncbi:MAG: hypothetical protein FWB85_00020 [Chitinispirillia bacterium]|nr:hypothetical protein [Chitinispirillia bacterium]MCL2240896.1 hypothetical protein [Chitinispirillia bacterium]
MINIRTLSAAVACAALTGMAYASLLPQCPDNDYGCIIAVIHEYSEGAGLPVADTLYRALDAAGRLNSHELLRYGRVKSLLGNYRAAASIYCRAATGESRLEHAALTQMGHQLADADSAEKAAAVRIFERCALAAPNADTALFRNWLADFCGRQGLFEQEISILTRLHSAESPSDRRLAEAARKHFSNRRYRFAVRAAAAAHDRTADESQKSSDAAFVAYQSYMQLRVRDSALIWLRLSGVAGKDANIQAAALNQETGHLEAAAALIDSLPVSLPKDTLGVRQYLFSGEPANALNFIMMSKSAAWTMAPRERMLWRGRCMIFGGRAYEAIPVLDSLRFMPGWHAASEVLRYKYWVQKLDDDRGALDLWGKLEYAIYTGSLTAAVRLLKGAEITGEPGEMLAVRLAKVLAQANRHAAALEILELAEGGPGYGIKGIDRKSHKHTPGPEYLYLKAEMLSETGKQYEAKVFAQKILTDYPLDVFAQKARILLSKI